ncbi:MAG: GAF domain-containing protein [Chloroflexi bacterium]|nr:GAF domain-containing protein [Chloroflexota bacterium]MBU1879296.1 GAF domain-containing protein [Chloroflexota bacterium]
MIARFTKYLAAPVFPDEKKTRAASLVNAILLITLALMITLPLIMLLVAPGEAAITSIAAGVMAAIILGLLFLVRWGYVSIVGVLLTSAFLVMVTWSIYSYRGVRDLTITGYFLVIALAGLLLGGRAVIIFGLLCLLLVVGVSFAETSGLITVSLEATTPVFQLVTLMVTLGLMALLLRFAVNSIAVGFERARRSAQALAESNRDLEASRDALAARTQELERRYNYQTASTRVSHAVNTSLDPQRLMQEVVELIRNAFDLYYVGLFTLDEAGAGTGGKWVILQADSSKTSQSLVSPDQRLQVDASSLIGLSIMDMQARVWTNTSQDTAHLSVPELPDTRSEVALPLRSRGQVIGALIVQSDRPAAFEEDAVVALQTMADQVAVALDNAHLFAESQLTLETERRAHGAASRAAWAQLVSDRADTGYRYTGQSVVLAENDWRPEMLQAAQTNQIVQGSDAEGTLAVPIQVRDQVVGVLNLRKATTGETWTDEEETLLQTLTDQLGVALESARLYQDTQRRAAQERLTGEITARMRETLDLETIVQTAAREMRRALNLAEAEVRIGTASESGQS